MIVRVKSGFFPKLWVVPRISKYIRPGVFIKTSGFFIFFGGKKMFILDFRWRYTAYKKLIKNKNKNQTIKNFFLY